MVVLIVVTNRQSEIDLEHLHLLHYLHHLTHVMYQFTAAVTKRMKMLPPMLMMMTTGTKSGPTSFSCSAYRIPEADYPSTSFRSTNATTGWYIDGAVNTIVGNSSISSLARMHQLPSAMLAGSKTSLQQFKLLWF